MYNRLNEIIYKFLYIMYTNVFIYLLDKIYIPCSKTPKAF